MGHSSENFRQMQEDGGIIGPPSGTERKIAELEKQLTSAFERISELEGDIDKVRTVLKAACKRIQSIEVDDLNKPFTLIP